MANPNSLKAYLQNSAGAEAIDTVRRMNADGDVRIKPIANLAEVITKSYMSLSETVVDSIQALITISSEKLDHLVQTMMVLPRQIAAEIPKQMAVQQRYDPTVKSNLAKAEEDREQRKIQKSDSPWGLLKEILATLKQQKSGSLLGIGAGILGLGALTGFLGGAVWGKFVSSVRFLTNVFEVLLPLKITQFFKGLKATWVSRIGDMFRAAKTAITSRFVKIFDPIAKLFGKETKIGQAARMISNVVKWITTAFFPSFLKIGKMFGGFVGDFVKIFGRAAKLGAKVFVPIGWLIDIVMGIVSAVKTAMAGGSIKEIIISFFAGFVNSLTFGLLKTEKLKEWFGDFVDWVIRTGEWTLEEVIKPAWNWVGNLFIEIVDALRWTWENVGKPAWAGIEWFFEQVTLGFTTALEGARTLWDGLMFLFDDIGRMFSSDEESFIITGLKATFFGFIDTLKGMLFGVANNILDVFKAVSRWIIGAVPGAHHLVPKELKDWTGFSEREQTKSDDKWIESKVHEYFEFKEARGKTFTKKEKEIILEKAKEGTFRENILQTLESPDDNVSEEMVKYRTRIDLLDNAIRPTPRLELTPGANLYIPASRITDSEERARMGDTTQITTNSGNTTVIDNRNLSNIQKSDVLVAPTANPYDTMQGRDRFPRR